MATSDSIINHNQFETAAVTNKDDGTITYGKHTIPRANVPQSYSRNTRKEDENHLIFRREDEKEEDTETTGASEDAEVPKSIY